MSKILAFVAWFKNLVTEGISFGWQDENGFHYGMEDDTILHYRREDEQEDK
jgi:hypothetical protein